MKVRVLPIFLSILFSSLLLFGGWYVFQNQFVKKPIANEIAVMKDVKLNHINVKRDSVVLNLTFNNSEKFAEEYKQIQKIVADKSNGKNAVIELDSPNKQLKKVWDDNAFAIAEAMDLHTYSRIPGVLNDIKKKHQLASALSHMDEENIYIYLNDGKSSYYTVLPRQKEVSRNG
ncbi:hypothetical protein [Aneurinibacillus tyrosinisolvens]|uniref:hypothetical protein n=1 Tax=Aneurinibacillus tyrosinisolvens TaxID=1443435 RepID=UPI00063EE3CC|nr:hypothetical protein [Aneurinibacillus tyrosinisolvens]